MKKIAFALVASAALFAVTGCTSSVQTSIENATPKICSGAAAVHVAYEAAKGFVKVSAKDDKRVEAAFASLQPFCDGTATGDPATLAQRAAQAFAVFISAVNATDVSTGAT